jgi:hypothetical protein
MKVMHGVNMDKWSSVITIIEKIIGLRIKKGAVERTTEL